MNVRNEAKICQIVAAQPGWKAVYCQGHGEVKISNRVIICWALVEIIGANGAAQTEVRGVVQESGRLTIVGDMTATDDITGKEAIEKQYFLGYNDPDEHKETDYWINQAQVRIAAKNAKTAEPRD